MLGCIRGATIAFGLIVAVAPSALVQERVDPALESQPVPEPRQHTSADQRQPSTGQQEADAERLIPALNAIGAAIRGLIVKEDPQQRERQAHHETADLQAQQDMAFWAKAMFWATFATVLVTAVGIWLIYWTLIYTRRAAEAAAVGTKAAIDTAKEAQRTSDAAIEANNFNRQAFIAEHRPWLKVDIRIAAPLKWNRGGGNFIFDIVITNVGRTPALQAFPHLKIILAANGVQPDKTQAALAERTRLTESVVAYTIFPGETIIPKHGISVSDHAVKSNIAALHNGNPSNDSILPYLIGCVDYKSPADSRHQTGFIYEIYRHRDGAQRVIRPSEGDIPADGLCLIRWIKTGRID
jgi:hypothetical protein